MSYTVTKSRVLQWLGIIAILCLFGGAYWYFKVYGSTLNAPQNDLNTNGLVGMWSFNGDDISGVTAYDRSGSGNNGTLTNGPVATQGKVGQALDFDGTNDYVATTDYSYSNAQAFTMSVWFKADTVSGNQVIFSKTTYEYNLRLTGSVLDFSYWDTGGLGEIDLSYSNVVANKWYLVNVVYTGSGAAYLYVDGVRVSSDTNIVDTFQNKAEALLIGGGYHISGNPGYLNGQIDEMRIYNRAITASEVTALYTQGGGTKSNTSISQPQGTGRLDSGLALYWPLDDNTGTNASDESTNNNDGTLTGGPTWITEQIGSAVDFDGSDDYVTVADPSSGVLDMADSTNFTLAGWFNRGSNSTDDTIIGKRSGQVSGNTGYSVWIDATNDDLQFEVCDGFDEYRRTSTTTFTGSGWNHFVAVFDDAVGMTIYINGKVDQDSASGTLSSIGTLANSVDFRMGAESDAGVLFDGKLDEGRMYNRALSADEVSQLYRLTAPTSTDTGLEGYWSFNGKDLSGTTAYDRSGAGNTGTLTGGPSIAEGKLAQGLSFDGSDDYVSVADNTALDVDDTADISISGWFYRDTDTTTDMVVAKKAGLTSSHVGYGVYIDSASDKLVLEVCDGVEEYLVTSSTVFAAGSGWVHFVAVWDQDSATGSEIYINGIANNGVDSGDAIGSLGSLSQSIAFSVGAESDADNPFDGKIDEVRVYNRALSVAEIKGLYDVGADDKTNSAASQPQGTGRLDSGLAGYWPLDTGSGTTAVDLSVNGNNGTVPNSWTTGQVGGAVSFDGTNTMTVAAGTGVLDAKQDVTFSAWVYPRSVGNYRSFFYKGVSGCDEGSAKYMFELDVAGYLRLWMGGAYLTSTKTLVTSQWQHIVATNSASRSVIYVNGVLVASGAGMAAPASSSEDWTFNKCNRIDANMDEIRIYNRALSDDEVAQLYRLNTPSGTETSLKGYWSFNGKDMSSTTAFDSSGGGNSGTLTNGPAITEGKIGQGLAFDGTNDYVEMASTTTTYQYANTTFTVTGWFKKSGSSDGYIISQDVCNGGWGVRLNSGTLQFRLKSSGGCGGDAASRSSSTTSLNDGGWHHFAAVVTTDTVTSGNNDIVLYIDGAINQGSISRNGSPYATVATNLRVGYTDGAGGYFNGSLDEVRVYNRSLTAAEIAALYNASR